MTVKYKLNKRVLITAVDMVADECVTAPAFECVRV